jgi:hypothetical protein
MGRVYLEQVVNGKVKAWAKRLEVRDYERCSKFNVRIDKHRDNCYRGHLDEGAFWHLFPRAMYLGHMIGMRPSYDFLTLSYPELHGGNVRCDCKARGVKGYPRENYWVNVVAADMERSSGVIYSFGFVDTRDDAHKDKKVPTLVWQVGWMDADRYKREALYLGVGEKQPDNPNDFEIEEARYSMQIRDLEVY